MYFNLLVFFFRKYVLLSSYSVHFLGFFSQLSLDECKRKKNPESVNIKQILKDILKRRFFICLQLHVYPFIYSLTEVTKRKSVW